MTDFEYEERYGERVLGDWETELENERIEKEERMENLEKCVEAIKDLVGSVLETKEEYQETLSEIKELIDSLD